MSDKNISGQAYSLIVIAPILPGHEGELRAYLDGLPTGPESPIIRRGMTHFTRFVIIPQLVYEGPPQKRDVLHSQYLFWESNFDGVNLNAYLDDLCQVPEEMDAIWGHCVGYPGGRNREDFRRYMRHNQIETAFFFAPYGDLTVSQVLETLAVRDRIIEFAMRVQDMDADALYNAYLETFGRRSAPAISAAR